MSNQTNDQAEKLERNARRVSLFISVLITLAALYTTFTFASGGTDFSSFSITWAVAVFAGIAYWLSRRGNGTLGVGIFLGILWLAIATSPFRNAGNGLLLGIFNVLLTLSLAPQTMPPRQALRVIGGGVLFGIFTILVDWYWPAERPPSPESTFFVLATFGTGLVVVNAYFLSRQIREYSLRAKLTIGFLSIAVLSVGIVGVITSLVARREITNQVGESVETLASTVAQQVGNTLNAQVEVLQVIATRFDRITESASVQYTGTPEEIQRELLERDAAWQAADGTDQIILDIVNNSTSSLLRDFRRTVPAHAEIFLTDVYGANIAATNRTTDFYQADEEWWQVAYSGGEGSIYISKPVYDESAELFSIEFAVPVFANGRVVGILRSTFNAAAFSEILETVEKSGTLSEDVDIRIADDLVIELETNEIQVISPETQIELDKIAEGFEVIPFEGRNALSGQALLGLTDSSDPHDQAISQLGWSIIVHQDINEALLPVENTTRTIVLLSIGILFGTGLLAYNISINLSRPIVKLTEVAEKVRGGDLEIQAEVSTQDEIGTLATTFNSMTAQVRGLVATLEQRVAERTRALATSTEVSRRLSTILNQDELVREVVEQVQQAFDYYHVHIYLWDARRENLVMAGGTGEAGRMMLVSGHSIPAERGLVGRAAETGTVVLVSDVSQTIGWLPNPLLPDTKAEIAVPILLGNTVLGVLDVQQNVVNGLTQNDADLLQAIANQVAIALQNAQAYSTARGQAAKDAQRIEIVQKIQNTTSIEEALKVAVRELGRAMDVPASVYLSSNINSSRSTKHN